MINQAPTKEFKMLGPNVLHPLHVAICHGMSSLDFHHQLVLRNSMMIYSENRVTSSQHNEIDFKK